MTAPREEAGAIVLERPGSPYPAHREADVVLRDGSTIHVRPVRPDDQAPLLTFYRGLSEEARDCGWPKCDLSRRTTMRFDKTSEVVDDPRAAERALWEGVR